LANRLRSRGRRPPDSPTHDQSAEGDPDSANLDPEQSLARPIRASNSSICSRRPHPYQRTTRSSARQNNSPVNSVDSSLNDNVVGEIMETSAPSSTSSSPAATSRRAARMANMSRDAASQQRLFLRRNLISAPRVGDAVDADARPAIMAASNDASQQTRRGRGRGRANAARTRQAAGSQLETIRDRLHPPESRSRSASASSIIRARLTARISFGQRLVNPQSPPGNGTAATSAAATSTVPNPTDRLTRNGARRAAEAIGIVDQR